jgi:LDH2 family malate/lactate/ureidoglycolate dehydrogenase
MAAWGGKEAILGTNPFAFGFPAGEYPPIIIDMATSAGARGKIFVSAKKGEQPGWALDSNGSPTQDPHEALKGVQLPFAGPKGYGLALMVDILGGVITGSSFGKHIPALYDKPDQPQDIGHLIVLIDVERFMGMDQFRERMESMIKDIKETKKMEGTNEIFLPGEIEHNKYIDAQREGIIMAGAIYHDLLDLGSQLGVAPETVRTVV